MADQQDRHIGQTLGGYRLLRRLGRGTFGTVYLATHLHTGSPVAVKILQVHLASLKDFKRFLNEARTICLRHPHIVPVLDFGVSKEDVSYLVMEYAAGGTLRHRHPRGSRLDLPTILSYTEQLASALQYAHDQRVIHRDLKPENILVRSDGTLLLSDFGMATVVEASSLVSRETFLGTPAYMAPEQGSGKPCFASDQYALAVVLYEWITGQLPFQGSALEVAVQHRLNQPPALRNLVPELPSAAEQVVLKALSKEPMERFLSLTAFAQAVREAFQAGREESTLAPQSASGTLLADAPASDRSHSLSAVPRPAPSSPPAQVVTPEQGNVTLFFPASADEASVLAPGASMAALPPPLSAPLQPPSGQPVQKVAHDPVPLSSLSVSVRAKRLLPAVHVRVLICLVLVLVVGGSLGTWIVAMHNATATSLTNRNATATVLTNRNAAATALANRNATATATALANRNATATTTALANRNATATATALANPGQVWHAHTVGTSQNLAGVAWSGTEFVAVGAGGTILTSPNGRTWTVRQSSPDGNTLSAVTWGNSQFVAVGEGRPILTSSDGRTWTAQNSGSQYLLAGVVWSGTEFVAVGYNSLTSSDGRTWTGQDPGTFALLYGVAWSGTEFVAVGDGGTILTSSDGRTWKAQNSDTSQNLAGVAWSGTEFVAVGAGETILTSPDGRTWTVRQSFPNSDTLFAVTWGNSQFVAVGAGGTILTSPNGHTWKAQNSGTSQELAGIAWSGTEFVAVGAGGMILTSP